VDKNEGPEAAFLHRSERARARRLIPIDPQQNYKAKTGWRLCSAAFDTRHHNKIAGYG